MTKLRRIKEVLWGLLMIFCALILFLAAEEGYYLITFLLSISLILSGGRSLVYYFQLARHMIGGKWILYKGICLMDLGLFTLTLMDIPVLYVMLYLLIVHAFAGLVDILKAFEARKIESPAWKKSMSYGICNLLVGLLPFLGILTHNSLRIAVYTYSAGLLYSAIVRIGTSFRKTAIVYIP